MLPRRSGLGFDVHRFDPERPLLLGGVLFDGAPGLAGHSDGDAVCHALADALLGAASAGDVGEHFPDTDPSIAGIGGRRPVLEALRAGRASAVLVATGARRTTVLREVLEGAARASVALQRVAGPLLDRTAGPNHQGVAASVVPPAPLDERALASLPLDPEALIVVLDGIEDPQNLGACARSSEAAGAAALVVRDRRAAPMSASAIRASAG